MITLKNERLAIKIAEPNLENITYRFDRAGFIVSAVLDGQYEFCSSEGGGSNGVGICSEIVTPQADREVPIGSRYPKFGVGLLLKEDEKPYSFMGVYDTESVEIETTVSENSVVFETAPVDFPYTMKQKKTVSIEGNRLRVAYEVTNTGSEMLEFTEYAHNFLSCNGHALDPSYMLQMTNFAITEDAPFECWLDSRNDGLKVCERDDFVPHHMGYWTNFGAMSPEIFFGAKLAPGESTHWTREYEFVKYDPA